MEVSKAETSTTYRPEEAKYCLTTANMLFSSGRDLMALIRTQLSRGNKRYASTSRNAENVFPFPFPPAGAGAGAGAGVAISADSCTHVQVPRNVHIYTGLKTDE